MSWHAVVPAPFTILKGVRKLPPASTLMIEADGRRVENVYWRPTFNPDPTTTRFRSIRAGRFPIWRSA